MYTVYAKCPIQSSQTQGDIIWAHLIPGTKRCSNICVSHLRLRFADGMSIDGAHSPITRGLYRPAEWLHRLLQLMKEEGDQSLASSNSWRNLGDFLQVVTRLILEEVVEKVLNRSMNLCRCPANGNNRPTLPHFNKGLFDNHTGLQPRYI